MPTRRLSLQRETLTDLAPDELALVAGGDPIHTIPLAYCLLSNIQECHYTSPCTN